MPTKSKRFTLVNKEELERFHKYVNSQASRRQADISTLPDPLMNPIEKAIRSTDDDLNAIANNSSEDIWSKVMSHARRLERHRADSKRALSNRGTAGVDFSRPSSDNFTTSMNRQMPSIPDKVPAKNGDDAEWVDIVKERGVKKETKQATPSRLRLSLQEKDLLESLRQAGVVVDSATGALTLDGIKMSKEDSRNVLRDALKTSKNAKLASSSSTWAKFKKETFQRNLPIARLQPSLKNRAVVRTGKKRKLSEFPPTRAPVFSKIPISDVKLPKTWTTFHH